jgi:hypothetical protein
MRQDGCRLAGSRGFRAAFDGVDNAMAAEVTVRRAALTRVLVIAAALVILANLTFTFIRFFTGKPSVFGLVRLFDVESEGNVPTWFSSVLLLTAAALLAWIARGKHIDRDRFRRHWAALALIFFWMSLDETAVVHEMLSRPTKLLVKNDVGGLLHYTWVIPGALFVVIVGLAFLKFLLALPRRIGIQFVIAGAVFVGGAIGVELAGGWYASTHGSGNLPYRLLATLEESCEMAGVIIFIDALLACLASQSAAYSLRVTEVGTPTAASNA